jgi:hypothetical protein
MGCHDPWWLMKQPNSRVLFYWGVNSSFGTDLNKILACDWHILVHNYSVNFYHSLLNQKFSLPARSYAHPSEPFAKAFRFAKIVDVLYVNVVLNSRCLLGNFVTFWELVLIPLLHIGVHKILIKSIE